MITFTLTGELVAEPRPGQLTNEGSDESTRRALENPQLDPAMRAYYEDCLARPRLRQAVSADGQPYTYLRVMHEDRRFEVIVRGDRMVEQAVALEPGAQLRLTCELTGQEPHFSILARRIKEMAHAS